MDYEVKADPLEAAFEAAVVPAAILRPQLAAGDTANPARSAFVEGYLRKGREVELKSFAGNVPADGGYAVPKEIDAVIDATLKSISPNVSDNGRGSAPEALQRSTRQMVRSLRRALSEVES